MSVSVMHDALSAAVRRSLRRRRSGRTAWCPGGIVLSVVGTAVLGSSYLLTLLFCIQVRLLVLKECPACHHAGARLA